MKLIKSILLIASLQSFAIAQNAQQLLESTVIESILDTEDLEDDVQSRGEELEFLRQHPTNITNPSYDELVRIPFVSPMLAEAIIIFADTVSVSEISQLLSVSSMTPELFEKIAPFIVAESSYQLKTFGNMIPDRYESRSRLEKRMQITKGFNENKYPGDANAAYQRIRLSSQEMEISAIGEKDAGETYDKGLVGGSILLKDISYLDEIIVGSYSIASAQGLVLARSMSSSKGYEVINQTRKRGRVISPYISTNEFRYYQGIASRFSISNISTTLFYSLRDLPASTDSNNTVTSFYTSGLYRTINEQNRLNVLQEKTFGSRIAYSYDQQKTVALTLMNVEYGKIISPDLLKLRDQRFLSAGSLSWDALFNGWSTFGEIATNDVERFSKVIGITVPVSKEFALTYHYRLFSQDYVSPFAGPFGVRSNISQGEVGKYFGVEASFGRFMIRAYRDDFSLRSPTGEFGTTGSQSLLQISSSLSRKIGLTMHMRSKNVFDRDARSQTNYRLSYSYKASRSLTLSNRFEWVTTVYDPAHIMENGFLIFSDVSYKNNSLGMMLKGRLILFDTQSYDSRLYQYESDVAGNYSNPPMYGKGIRWYIVLGLNVFKDFRISFKYSETQKLNERDLGSGDDLIQGNIDNRIALQLDFQM